MNAADLLENAEAHLGEMRIAEAAALFDLAEESGCEADACSAGRWTCYMLQGRFEKAWRESEAIAARGRPDPHRFWDGHPLEGQRVLIRCLHGLGDTIQFIRYAPLIRKIARSVTIEAQPELRSLLANSGLADEVITWGDKEPLWDTQVEVIELPRIFRTQIDSIPNTVPYLKGFPRAVLAEESALRVGIVWASSKYNPARTLPMRYVLQILRTGGIHFYSLQAGAERLALQRHGLQVPDLYKEGGCAATTAGFVQGMDLIITADTMMAHLAGALGRPVWTLLPHECDWRWMMEREDSPWYPTMRLFRQPRRGEWGTPVTQVRTALKRLVEEAVDAPDHGIITAEQNFAD